MIFMSKTNTGWIEFRWKSSLNKRYQKQYKVSLSVKELSRKSIKDIAKKLAQKRINKRQKEAVIIIQKHFRR